MLAYLQIMASFAAICVLCLFVVRARLCNASLAPLAVVSSVMVVLVLGGYLGCLQMTGAIVFALALFALGQMIATKQFTALRAQITPGFALFVLAGFAFITLFAIRQPMAQGWDEFSLWATAAKLTTEHNVIYSAAPIGWPWVGTQKPGLPTFAYFFNFFGEYAAWRLYSAYAVLYVAIWAALLGNLRWKQWTICVPSALLAFLLPFFTVYLRDIYVNYLYIDSYADFPMGVFGAGVLAWYFWSKQVRFRTAFLCVLLSALALYKDTGLALACILIMIMFVDNILASGDIAPFSIKTLAKKCVGAGAMFFSVVGTYVASALYLGTIQVPTTVTTVASTARTEEIGMATMLIEGTKALLGIEPGAIGARYVETFATVKAQMIGAFFPSPTSDITIIGCGAIVACFIIGVLLVSAILTTDKKMRLTAFLYAITSSIGFVLYYTFIGFTYVYVFKNGITDYNRYVNTYYLLWLGGALAILICSAAKGSRKNLLTLGTLVLSLGFLLRFNQMVQRQLSVIDYPDVIYDDHKASELRTMAVQSVLAPDDEVFYVHTNDDGRNWFETSYELIPNILVYSHGGGPLHLLYGNGITAQELAAEIAVQGCAYVYVDVANQDFFNEFGTLFTDGGAGALSGEVFLYKVVLTGEPTYTPVTKDMVRNPERELRADGTVAYSEEGQRKQFERVLMTNAQSCFALEPVVLEVPAV